MAGSTSNLDLIESSQGQKEVTANALFDAMSTASLFGRRASECVGLIWAFYGGAAYVLSGSPEAYGITQLPNDEITLVGSATNYVEVDSYGVVSSNTIGFTSGYVPLYSIVTSSSTVTSYTDHRISIIGVSGAGVLAVNGQTGIVVLSAGGINIADAGGYFSSTNTEGALQELGAAVGVLSGLSDVLTFKGVINCSANPNYPAANAGDTYRVSVAGKIGGGSGPNVEVGDLLLCTVDATAAGTHAGVGANWSITQNNLDGTMIGPATATANALVLFDGTTGKLAKDSGYTVSAAGAALLDDADAAAQRATLGLVIGTHVQAYAAGLSTAPTDITALRSVPLGLFYPGKPGNAEVILRYTFTVGATLAASATGSDGDAGTAATGSSTFTIKKNGASVGSFNFAAAATVPTFTVSSLVTFVAGDILTIEAPATADATLADFNVQLLLVRAV